MKRSLAAGAAEFPPVPRMSPDEVAVMLDRCLGDARKVVRYLEGVPSEGS